jgi:arylsulfatase A-like enzyme
MSETGGSLRLLVVTVDRLPAWILPAYGATWVAMPTVNRLAARGVVFDGLVATSDDPRDAAAGLTAWLVDRRPGGVGIVTDDPSITGTLAGCEATVVPISPTADVAADEEGTHLARLFAAAAARAARRQDDMIWCHTSSLAACWDAPEEFREQYLDPEDPPPPRGAAVPELPVTSATDPDLITGLRHVFAAQLTLLDRCVGRLLDAMGDAATILVAGLRGMPLGLHGRIGPGASPPFGEIADLPAILVDARGRMAGQRHGGLLIPADLGATLAAMHGEASSPSSPADPWQGRSLAGLFESWSTFDRDRVITAASTGVAVTTPGWRLVTPSAGDASGRQRLYARPDDLFERCDVADRSAAVGEELAALAAAALDGRTAEAWRMPLSAAAAQSG